MLKILVIGSMEPSDQNCREFLGHLAKEMVDRGHHLLNGCRNELDRVIADSVHSRLVEKGEDPRKNITCYVSPDKEPVHEHGTILKSQCRNWGNLASPELDIPETIAQADVVFVIGGKEGTECAANWARIAKKPLLPITKFEGTAANIFQVELKNFSRYADRIEQSDYEILNQISSDLGKIAQDVVALAGRAVFSNQVFVIMSFSENHKLTDAYESFEIVCKEYNYQCIRIDNTSSTQRIIPEIFKEIKKSAVIIADLSEPRPNVYYELGYATALKKKIIATAEKGTSLPFDITDLPTIFWENQKQLKEQLREKLKQVVL